jgi:hypothetical protein
MNLKYPVLDRFAQITIYQQNLVAGLSHNYGQISGYSGLTVLGAGTADHYYMVILVYPGKTQIGAQGTIRFGKSRLGVILGNKAIIPFLILLVE